MSTPNRICPECAGALDADGRCSACAATGQSEELVAKAEALFGSYLAARIVRARRALKAAKIEMLRDPRNREKANTAQIAEEETQRLQAQLVAHTRSREQASQSSDGEPQAGGAAAETTNPPSVKQTTSSASTRQDGRQCPRCSAHLPGSISQCRCGYTFEPTGPGLPPIFLTPAELAALQNSGKRR